MKLLHQHLSFSDNGVHMVRNIVIEGSAGLESASSRQPSFRPRSVQPRGATRRAKRSGPPGRDFCGRSPDRSTRRCRRGRAGNGGATSAEREPDDAAILNGGSAKRVAARRCVVATSHKC
jgi:hypothetical protein